MSTIRVNKTKGFTIMSNYHLRDKNISLKAKGLMSVMLSLPDDWNYSVGGLVAISKESETAIKSTLNELKRSGYLVVTKLSPNKTKSGRYEYIYDVYENPNAQHAENQPSEKQCVEKQGVGNQPLECLQVENHIVYKNNNNQSTDNQSTDKKGTYDKKKQTASCKYDYESFVSIYNGTCSNLGSCRSINDNRKKAIKTFLKDYSLEDWKEICKKANESDFLTGKNDHNWKANFDFLLRIDKAAKIMEGAYGSKPDYRDRYAGYDEGDPF